MHRDYATGALRMPCIIFWAMDSRVQAKAKSLDGMCVVMQIQFRKRRSLTCVIGENISMHLELVCDDFRRARLEHNATLLLNVEKVELR